MANLANRARGEYGERRAATWYSERGFEEIARNWRSSRTGELDLIVRRGSTVVVCEVKARRTSDYGFAAEAVTPVKQARIRRLAVEFLAASGLHGVTLRFDVVAVTGTEIEVYEDVF